MKKIKFFLIAFFIVTYSNFAHAMEKNPVHINTQKNDNNLTNSTQKTEILEMLKQNFIKTINFLDIKELKIEEKLRIIQNFFIKLHSKKVLEKIFNNNGENLNIFSYEENKKEKFPIKVLVNINNKNFSIKIKTYSNNEYPNYCLNFSFCKK